MKTKKPQTINAFLDAITRAESGVQVNRAQVGEVWRLIREGVWERSGVDIAYTVRTGMVAFCGKLPKVRGKR